MIGYLLQQTLSLRAHYTTNVWPIQFSNRPDVCWVGLDNIQTFLQVLGRISWYKSAHVYKHVLILTSCEAGDMSLRCFFFIWALTVRAEWRRLWEGVASPWRIIQFLLSCAFVALQVIRTFPKRFATVSVHRHECTWSSMDRDVVNGRAFLKIPSAFGQQSRVSDFALAYQWRLTQILRQAECLFPDWSDLLKSTV